MFLFFFLFSGQQWFRNVYSEKLVGLEIVLRLDGCRLAFENISICFNYNDAVLLLFLSFRWAKM